VASVVVAAVELSSATIWRTPLPASAETDAPAQNRTVKVSAVAARPRRGF
jgi:hypothetical protein